MSNHRLPTIARHGVKRLLGDSAGAAMLEFALTLPVVLLLIVGIFDFGMLFQRYEVLTNAAREGARTAILPGYTTADVESRVRSYMIAGGVSDFDSSGMTVVAETVNEGGPPFTTYRVNVPYEFTFSILKPVATLFGATFDKVTLTATSVMRTEVMGGT